MSGCGCGCGCNCKCPGCTSGKGQYPGQTGVFMGDCGCNCGCPGCICGNGQYQGQTGLPPNPTFGVSNFSGVPQGLSYGPAYAPSALPFQYGMNQFPGYGIWQQWGGYPPNPQTVTPGGNWQQGGYHYF